MNLAKLFEAQRILVARIEKEHPRAEGEDRLSKLILALQVELGELANEWRGFKFWSNDQDPRNKDIKCHACKGSGVFSLPDDPFEPCLLCDSTGIQDKNPMLIEYVDCLHVLLNIGLELNIQEHYAEEVNFNIGSRTKRTFPTDEFRNTFRKIAVFDMHWNEQDYMDVFSSFTTLGDSLGFTEDQIEQAYYEKNEINHLRQANGY